MGVIVPVLGHTIIAVFGLENCGKSRGFPWQGVYSGKNRQRDHRNREPEKGDFEGGWAPVGKNFVGPVRNTCRNNRTRESERVGKSSPKKTNRLSRDLGDGSHHDHWLSRRCACRPRQADDPTYDRPAKQEVQR